MRRKRIPHGHRLERIRVAEECRADMFSLVLFVGEFSHEQAKNAKGGWLTLSS